MSPRNNDDTPPDGAWSPEPFEPEDLTPYDKGGAPDGPKKRPKKDHKDKVPALIEAARKARDDDTKLLLLQKARQVDPSNLEVYLRRAAIYARRGDESAERAEYHAALDADPTNWFVRYQLLNLEYPIERNLKHAAGIVRDLAWEKGITERFLNAGRGALRSESELSYDQAVLGHLVLAGGGEYGVVDLSRASVNGAGAAVVLNALEPWLQTFDADGSLVYGTDLWLSLESEPLQDAADVALCGDGTALVCSPGAGLVVRLEPDGSWAKRGISGLLVEEPIAVAVREAARAAGDAYILCGKTGRVVRVAVGGGGAREEWRLPLAGGAAATRKKLQGATIAAARDGTGFALVGGRVYVLPRGGDRPDLDFPVREGPRPGAWKGGGIAVDPTDGTLVVADSGKGEVVRLDRAGARLERIADGKLLAAPSDVAVDGTGGLVIVDRGHARVLRRAPRSREFTVLFGGEGLAAPKGALPRAKKGSEGGA